MSSIEQYIVTTTIYSVSEAIKKFITFKDWKIIIVGDKKTPHSEYLLLEKTYPNVQYLTPEEQEKNYKEISNLIGWNNIQRRNIGFLEALKQNAQIIASVDDDNIPLDNWRNNIIIGKPTNTYHYESKDTIVFDPIGVTNHNNLWHRGFPIQLLHNRNNNFKITRKTIIPDVQAMFWNGDPDIDALCRLQFKPMCFFDDKYFPISTNVYSPFNSQNTIYSREALKKYIVIPFIGRMDDIWGGYFLESLNFKVVYTEASVFQDRNVQNLTKNLINEFIGYEKTLDLLIKLKQDSKNIYNFIPDNATQVMKKYMEITNKL
tara:strand:+ start:230 stop:1183 length:954 start_codon:yes stop_codon:yes gene_type:complete